MHEMSLAQSLLDIARADVDAHPGLHPRLVRIAVGELASVEPKLLELAWREIGAELGSPAPQLEVDYCPCVQTCPTCGPVPDRQPGSWMRLCPSCDATLHVTGGDELDFVEIEYDLPE
ncbi:MAG: hydrogenase maturation nickel metallochaperone HypA [Planctomycetaceae bacterium]|nr:hydrogenase maturation nickel metallochaperone HypA [Planctomycetaceae bacterium]